MSIQLGGDQHTVQLTIRTSRYMDMIRLIINIALIFLHELCHLCASH